MCSFHERDYLRRPVDFATNVQIGQEAFGDGKFLHVFEVICCCYFRSVDLSEPSKASRAASLLEESFMRYVRYFSKMCPIESENLHDIYFVRGKKKARERIEDSVLSKYAMLKPNKRGWEYTLGYRRLAG